MTGDVGRVVHGSSVLGSPSASAIVSRSVSKNVHAQQSGIPDTSANQNRDSGEHPSGAAAMPISGRRTSEDAAQTSLREGASRRRDSRRDGPSLPAGVSHELESPRVRQDLSLGRRVAQAGQVEHGGQARVLVGATREGLQTRALAAPVPLTRGERAARGGVAAHLLLAGRGGVLVETAREGEAGDEVAHGCRYAWARPLIHARCM